MRPAPLPQQLSTRLAHVEGPATYHAEKRAAQHGELGGERALAASLLQQPLAQHVLLALRQPSGRLRR